MRNTYDMQIYEQFTIQLASVGLAQARPNNRDVFKTDLHTCC